jgi:PAS domain S-box-containing protein
MLSARQWRPRLERTLVPLGRRADRRIPTCGRSGCKSAIDHIAMALTLSRQGAVIQANDKFYETSRYHPGEVIGADIRDFLLDNDPSTVSREVLTTLRQQDLWRGHVGFATKHGDPLWADLTLVPQRDPRGTVGSFILLGLDITDRKEAEISAAEERRRREDMESLLKDIVDTVPNGIVAYDDAGKVIFFNGAHEKLYGSIATGIAIGRDRASLISPKNEKVLRSPKTRERRSPAAAKHCCRPFVQKLPGDRWIQVQNRRSSAGRLISVQTEVTGLKRAEIAYQAAGNPRPPLPDCAIVRHCSVGSHAPRHPMARSSRLVPCC